MTPSLSLSYILHTQLYATLVLASCITAVLCYKLPGTIRFPILCSSFPLLISHSHSSLLHILLVVSSLRSFQNSFPENVLLLQVYVYTTPSVQRYFIKLHVLSHNHSDLSTKSKSVFFFPTFRSRSFYMKLIPEKGTELHRKLYGELRMELLVQVQLFGGKGRFIQLRWLERLSDSQGT